MRILVKGKNYEVPERDRAYAERKLGRLERLDERGDATVELSVEQHRNASDSHIVEVTLVIDGRTLRGTSAAPTHRAGIDDVLDKIERRTVQLKETSRVRKSAETVRHAGEALAAGEALPAGETGAAGPGMTAASRKVAAASGKVAAAGTAEADDARGRVVKLKRFGIEPMFEEDAVSRMEELGHAFFVFVNAENERIAILYRRDDGDYGLIEPVVGGPYAKGGASSPLSPSRRAGSGSARR
ncbi:MAG TPA: ribosome-associated translation inhibitor RaiA [Candidatus Limnocylindrales bacterium]|nr:ribosome-associated translation inhibitor RaiA [Candidatus Limnocylindrales bacterium]